MSHEARARRRFINTAQWRRPVDIIAMCMGLRFMQTLYTRDYRSENIYNARGIMHTHQPIGERAMRPFTE